MTQKVKTVAQGLVGLAGYLIVGGLLLFLVVLLLAVLGHGMTGSYGD